MKKDAPSDAFLFSGYDERLLHLTHDDAAPATFTLEVDRAGNNQWTELRRVEVPAAGYTFTAFAATDRAAEVCPVGVILKKRVGFAVPIGARTYDLNPISAMGTKGEQQAASSACAAHEKEIG